MVKDNVYRVAEKYQHSLKIAFYDVNGGETGMTFAGKDTTGQKSLFAT